VSWLKPLMRKRHAILVARCGAVLPDPIYCAAQLLFVPQEEGLGYNLLSVGALDCPAQHVCWPRFPGVAGPIDLAICQCFLLPGNHGYILPLQKVTGGPSNLSSAHRVSVNRRIPIRLSSGLLLKRTSARISSTSVPISVSKITGLIGLQFGYWKPWQMTLWVSL